MVMISDGNMTNLSGDFIACVQEGGVVPTSVPWEGSDIFT